MDAATCHALRSALRQQDTQMEDLRLELRRLTAVAEEIRGAQRRAKRSLGMKCAAAWNDANLAEHALSCIARGCRDPRGLALAVVKALETAP